jgi:hypothetical protein
MVKLNLETDLTPPLPRPRLLGLLDPLSKCVGAGKLKCRI